MDTVELQLPESHASVIYRGGRVAITLMGDIAVYGGTSKIHTELVKVWRTVFAGCFI